MNGSKESVPIVFMITKVGSVSQNFYEIRRGDGKNTLFTVINSTSLSIFD